MKLQYQTRLQPYLSWTACGVYQANAITSNILCFQSTGKKFVVGFMDRIAALEREYINLFRQDGPDLCWRRARENTFWKLKTLNFTSNIVLSTLH